MPTKRTSRLFSATPTTNILSLPSPSTAVFCSNDYIALGAIKGAREAGLTLPDDLSIVGFLMICRRPQNMAPALTTIRQPAYEMGQRAAKLLLQMIEKKLKPVQDMMDSTLIVRESTTKVQGTSDSSN
jgi:DNA-binding LacI/PurR family transcriptional regulator